jgi:CheY-like chemotaxis protein
VKNNHHILIVDDEISNIDIILNHLKKTNYRASVAHNGVEALMMLSRYSDLDLILLDRMMPVMDGMAFLERIKQDSEYSYIPVIMQTAASSAKQVDEGVKAGVYYYLKKPYTGSKLLAIINAALNDREVMIFCEQLKKMDHPIKRGIQKIARCDFTFRTLVEARNVAISAASFCPDSRNILQGIYELATNAIEHGNLDIGYLKKAALSKENKLMAEIERRLVMPEYKDKFATLSLEKTNNQLVVTIEDQGAGFDWREYSYLDEERAHDITGRGIYMALKGFNNNIEFSKNGRKVTCTWNLMNKKGNKGSVIDWHNAAMAQSANEKNERESFV